MAYSRPTYKRRAPARKYQTRRTASVYKKTVKAPRYAVATLDRKVNTLVRTMRGLKSSIQYVQNGNVPIGNIGGNSLLTIPISQYGLASPTWFRTFGADADDESNHSAIWKKSNIDCEFDEGTERANLDYVMYVVSLTKQGQAELFTPASGGLAGPAGITPPQDGVHFQSGAANFGLTMLNRKFFNIHVVKRFMTGSAGGVSYEMPSLRKRYYMKLNHNSGKGFTVTNPKGDWRAQPSPRVAGQNLYILIFSNDSTLDAAVQFKYNIIHSVDIA